MCLFITIILGIKELIECHENTQVRLERTLPNDGGFHRFSTALSPVHNDKGDVVFVMGIANNIANQMEDDEIMRILVSAIEQSNEGVAISDMEGNLKFVNKAFAVLHGYNPEELLNKNLSVFHTEEQMPSVEAVNKQIQTNGEFSGEIWHKRRDGTVFPAFMRNSIIRDNTGAPIGMIATMLDITTRKRAEEELRQSEEKYRTLQSNIPVGIFRTTPKGKFLYVNSAMVSMFGYGSEEELLNASVVDLYIKSENRQELIERLSNKGLLNDFEIPMKRRDGSGIWVSISVFAAFNQQGKFIHLDGIARDITGRKRAEGLLLTQRDLGMALSAAPGLDETFRICLEAAIHISGMDCGGVYLIDEISGDMDLVFHKGLAWSFVENALRYDVNSDNTRLVMEGKPIYTRHKQLGVSLSEETRSENLRAIAVIPVCYEDRIIACLNVASHTIEDVPDFARVAMETIANQVGNVIVRTKAEEALLKSEAKWRSVVENAPNMIIVADRDGTIQFVNHTASGSSVGDIIGSNVNDFILPEYQQIARDTFEYVFRTGKQGEYEAKGIDAYGHNLWYSIQAGLIKHDGQVNALTLIATDITERKQYEKRIEHLNELLLAIKNVNHIITHEKSPEKLVQGVCDSIIETDGHISAWIALLGEYNIIVHQAGRNDDYSRLVGGLERDSSLSCVRKVITKSDVVVIDNPASTCGDCPISAGYKNTGRMLIRLECNAKIYGALAVEVQSVYLPDDEERSLLKEVADDIAFALYNMELEEERKKLQEQLVHSEKLSVVGQLAAGVAHEFNNLLAVILGNSQLSLEEDSILEIKKSLREIEKVTKRGGDLVKDLSAFARPKEPQFRTHDITEIIDETIRMQKKQLHLENIQVEREYINPSSVSFDRGQIVQVFMNLLINATHAIKPKGRGAISISVKNEDSNVRIDFSDTGIGMDDEIKSKIFDPFFTTKGSWARNGLGISGTGLGLSVTHTIIQQHKGAITVESEKNKGATFTILIPISEAVIQQEKISRERIFDSEIERTSDLRIMIVDDEEDVINILKLALKRANHENVVFENNGLDAIKTFKDFNPDVVFLDVIMPDMSGLEVFNEMKSMNPGAPIIFMSGKLDLKKDDFIRAGAFDFIHKPFDVNDLFDILHRVAN